MFVISIHASRGGSDFCPSSPRRSGTNFNPRFPWGKRRPRKIKSRSCHPFQSTLPVGEATNLPVLPMNGCCISIHASRGGSDLFQIFRAIEPGLFQSTLPVGEATLDVAYHLNVVDPFQSTLPVGEATPAKWIVGCKQFYFNPRFPWGKRRTSGAPFTLLRNISIHASRGGSDRVARESYYRRSYFNPRFPWGKRPEFNSIGD